MVPTSCLAGSGPVSAPPQPARRRQAAREADATERFFVRAKPMKASIILRVIVVTREAARDPARANMNPQVIDLHCDTVGQILAGRDIAGGNGSGHVDLPRLRRGAVSAQVFACFVSSETPDRAAFRRATEMIRAVRDLCDRFPEAFRPVDTPGDLDATADGATVDVLLAVENGHAIEGDLGNLERLRREGVLYLTLTHSKNLPWAASSGEATCPFEGLTSFGRKVVEGMNEMGMIVDVSHVHSTTLRDVLRISRKPVIASHSNAAALCDTPRNLADDEIRALADGGGMIGVNFFPGFLDPGYDEALKRHCSDLFAELDRIEIAHRDDPQAKIRALDEFAGRLQRRMRGVPCPLDRIVDHVVHVVDLVGADHVGFGSDFDGVPSLPVGVTGSDVYPEILHRLRDRGIPSADLAKIAHGNFRRVLAANLAG
jgi:membrane dipeptidase